MNRITIRAGCGLYNSGARAHLRFQLGTLLCKIFHRASHCGSSKFGIEDFLLPLPVGGTDSRLLQGVSDGAYALNFCGGPLGSCRLVHVRLSCHRQPWQQQDSIETLQGDRVQTERLERENGFDDGPGARKGRCIIWRIHVLSGVMPRGSDTSVVSETLSGTL